MGLGKTAQSIVAAERVGAKRILVICPSSVKINWLREFLKWSSYKNIFIVGKQGRIPAKKCVIDTNAEVIIVNYDLCIMPNIKRQICSLKFDVGIMDEAHYLMNRTSGRTKAILARGGIIWSCDYKWALSGTIMKNRNRDCYAILRSLFPHVLGKYTQYINYANHFCGGHQGAFGFEDNLSTNTKELGEIMSKIMIRRTKTDVLSQLPELIEQNIYMDTTPAIEAVLNSEKEFTEDDKKAILNFEMLGETASYRKQLALAKLPQVIEYSKEVLDSVDKVTIFAYHRDMINTLADKLADYGVSVVMGGLTPEQKQYEVDKFVNDPNTRVFIGQIQAAGTGVDGLQTVCSDVIFAELDWVPGTVDQAKARCHRMGQQNATHIHYLVVGDSLEESMLNVLRSKRKNIEIVMKEVEQVVTPEQKGESKTMTLESSLERIAVALEKLVEHETIQINNESALIQAAVAAEEKPKKSKSKTKTKTEVVTETLVEAVPEALAKPEVEEPKAEEPKAEEPKVEEPKVAKAPKRDLQAVISECIARAQILKAKVGDAAAIYINEVTAQITGVEGSRLKDCNADQAEAVLDAINSKIGEI